MDNNILNITNLSHKYASDWAVKDVSFSIGNSGILGLLGGNGAGKSTIMNIMCGILNHTEGEVTINGYDIRKEPIKAKSQIGFLPQKAPLYHDLTVDEYLTHCAHLRLINPKEIPTAVEEAKEKTGITHFSNRLIKNLSGGYQQRTGIAGAIIHNPKLVVFDEPTNGLDPIQILEVRKIIKDISKDRAVIFSSHILSEIQAVCKEIIMVNLGKMVFSGSTEDFNNYIEPSSILVSLGNPPALDELEQIKGITAVEQVSNEQIRVTFNTDKSITETLVKASVKNGWQLKEINVERSSLDDVFAKITQDNS